ncbi:hypothetical protein F4780DRAFT_781878 [Xylariomycetidae sp. FL0641]|nr:hypothetical protein F4780DRAFT_781878 [Xylariomycetidae sp. FL0641]
MSGASSSSSSPTPESSEPHGRSGRTPSLKEEEENDGEGMADPKHRRKLQNRLNQRASRQRRKAMEETQKALARQRREDPRLIMPRPAQRHVSNSDQRLVRSASQASRIPASLPTPPPSTPHSAFQDPYRWQAFCYLSSRIWPAVDLTVYPEAEHIAPALFRASWEKEMVALGMIMAFTGGRLRQTHSSRDTRAYLEVQTRIAGLLREKLAANDTSDEVLFAVSTLAFQAQGIALTPSRGYIIAGFFWTPAQGETGAGVGLNDLVEGMPEFISRSSLAPEHITVLTKLINDCGGLGKIENQSLALGLQIIDIVDATLKVSKPHHSSLCRSMQFIRDQYLRKATTPPRTRECYSDVHPDLQELIKSVRICCDLIETYCSTPLGRRPTSILRQIIAIIQHGALSLPRGRDELCRLTMLVFAYGVFFYALPDIPMTMLTKQLLAVIEQPHSEHDQQLLFWAVMVGAIASANTDTEPSYLGHIRLFSKEMQIFDWPTARTELEGFVWLDRACDRGAQLMWNKALGERKLTISTDRSPSSRSSPNISD